MEVKKKSQNNVLSISKKKHKCPTCKKESSVPFTPFCSKNCADIDLMKWLSDEQFINLKTD